MGAPRIVSRKRSVSEDGTDRVLHIPLAFAYLVTGWGLLTTLDTAGKVRNGRKYHH